MNLIPVPRGMSDGFYAFMGAGCRRSDSGEILMLDPREDALRDAASDLLKACECALLFHRGGNWDEYKHLWPGGVPATSKGLCDYIRAAVAKAKGQEL